jgi:hypothetical protein
LPRRFESLVLDTFQTMPNHLHAIFVLPGPGLEPALAGATGAPIIQPTPENFVGRFEIRRGRACPTLGDSRAICAGGRASPPPTSDGRGDQGGRASPPPTCYG